jgi:hypothetical protein
MALNGLVVMSAVGSLFRQYVIKMITCSGQFPAKIRFAEMKIRSMQHAGMWRPGNVKNMPLLLLGLQLD